MTMPTLEFGDAAEVLVIEDLPATGLVAIGTALPATMADDGAEADFSAALGKAIEDLKNASLQSQQAHERVGRLAGELSTRGWLGALTATFTAKTDKELALQVEAVAASLQTTQSVLDVILKIETRENRLLDSFSKAVVDKIEKITSDTLVLRADQKNAALAFLRMLNARINEQKQLLIAVRKHAGQLELVHDWQQDVERGLGKIAGHLKSLQDGAQTAESRLRDAVARVGQCEEAIRSEACRASETANVIAQQKERIDHLEAANRTLSSDLIGLTNRLVALEGVLKTRASWRSRAIRYAPVAAALALAAAAVAGV